jgi:hypothetical protein
VSDDRCDHITDQWIPVNGGRVNLDQWLRVKRAKELQHATLSQVSAAVTKEAA